MRDSCCLLLWHHCTWAMGTACRGVLVFTSFLCPAALRPYLPVNKHANHKLAAQPLQLMHLHTHPCFTAQLHLKVPSAILLPAEKQAGTGLEHQAA